MLKKKGDFKMLKYRIKRKFKLLKNHIRQELKHYWIMIKLDFPMAISSIISLLFGILIIVDLVKHGGKFVYIKKYVDWLSMVCDKINNR